MKNFRWLLILLVVSLLLSVTALGKESKNPYVVGAFVSVTGPNAPLGTPERDTLSMMAEKLNKSGGINGHPLKLIIEDDGSDNTSAVKAAKKLIEQDNVCAIIGSSGTGPTMAVVPITEASAVPHISMAAGLAITNPVKKWVFRVAPTDYIVAEKLVAYLISRKLTKVAILYDSNAFGTSGRDQVKFWGSKNGLSFVAEESFGSKDTDMTVQLTKIRGSGAQAIICWGANPGPAQVAKNVQQLGITIPLFMSHGVADQTFLDQAGSAANGIMLPAEKLIVAEQLPSSDPQRKVLLNYFADYKAKFGKPADQYGGHGYDSFNIIVNALRKVGDDRVKLRDEIEKTKNYVGIAGVFNFAPTNHDGLTGSSCAMLKIVNGKWSILKN